MNLSFTPLQLSDAQDMFEQVTSEITAYTTFLPQQTLEEQIEVVTQLVKSTENMPQTDILYVARNLVSLTGAGVPKYEFVGILGLHSLLDMPEIGLWVSKKYQNKGYGTKFIEFGLGVANQLGYTRIIYSVACENEPSIGLLNKFRPTLVSVEPYTFTKADGVELQVQDYMLHTEKNWYK